MQFLWGKKIGQHNAPKKSLMKGVCAMFMSCFWHARVKDTTRSGTAKLSAQQKKTHGFTCKHAWYATKNMHTGWKSAPYYGWKNRKSHMFSTPLPETAPLQKSFSQRWGLPELNDRCVENFHALGQFQPKTERSDQQPQVRKPWSSQIKKL